MTTKEEVMEVLKADLERHQKSAKLTAEFYPTMGMQPENDPVVRYIEDLIKRLQG